MNNTSIKIDFKNYSDNVPQNISCSVRTAANLVMKKREERIHEIDDWEELRSIASDIKLHTLENLDYYLNVFEEKAQENGINLHWAEISEEACKKVLEISKNHNVRKAVKVKSMVTEEIGLNTVLEKAGIETIETDLGEFIIQLAGTGPSHIIVPAIHLRKEQIAEIFKKKLGVDCPPNATELTEIARTQLRKQFLQADMGISGANFLIAETGTIVIVSNEGNGRFCTSLPDLHVAVVGIDKVIPNWESASLFLKMLTRSATGQKITTYVSFISGINKVTGDYGPKEIHLILLDNSRSKILADPIGRETLKCIRCGCCLNACPIYKNVGGFAYGWFIPGPIGAIFTPQILGTKIAKELPFASSLCGACNEVCPVKVPFTQILVHLRKKIVEGDEKNSSILNSFQKFCIYSIKKILITNWLYKLLTNLIRLLGHSFTKDGWIEKTPLIFKGWTQVRPFPEINNQFRKWWNKKRKQTYE